jgi:hypothetical protein
MLHFVSEISVNINIKVAVFGDTAGVIRSTLKTLHGAISQKAVISD